MFPIFFRPSNHLRTLHLELTVNLQLDAPGGGSTLNRGHEHQRSIRRCRAREGRPRRFGGTQRDSGTRNDSSACIVQQWSVIPAAMAGVVCCV